MTSPPKETESKTKDKEGQAELESQFILRLPEEPATALKEVLRNGVSLKDRLTINLENDVRKGEVQFDHWTMHARVVDLPCIIESMKTLDRKTFYKTADICQMIICKEDEPPILSDEEDKNDSRKKESSTIKVNKKYQWPHGITPPMKNVRKRRFRKTLRKKSAEAPEIEKEMKRLLAEDAEAISVKWVIVEDDEGEADGEEMDIGEGDELDKEPEIKPELVESILGDEDIFGEVSDSDEDENNFDLETSNMSFEDQVQVPDSFTSMPSASKEEKPQTTELVDDKSDGEESIYVKVENPLNFGEEFKNEEQEMSTNEIDVVNIKARLDVLEMELQQLKGKRVQKEQEIANIENLALKQRFQEVLENLINEEYDKEQEFQMMSDLLKEAKTKTYSSI